MGSSNYGVYGFHQSTGNYGDLGDANYGVYGRHSSSNEGYLGSSTVGVYGRNGTTNNFGCLGGASDGVYGKHMGNNNYGQLGATLYGVYGYGNGASRYGVYGVNSIGNYGYLGGDSVGAYGKHNATGNYGYLGDDSSGVYAKCSTSSSNMCAVRAQNTGNGDGVYATVTGTTGSSAIKAEALAGTPSNSYAVEAVNYGSGGGVYAKCQAGAYALRTSGPGYFDGNVRVRDTLTVDDGIRGNQDSLVVHGTLNVTGAIYGFPRPAWNSGWFRLGTGDYITLTHNLGGDQRDYFVDLQLMQDSNETLNNFAIGGNAFWPFGVAVTEWGAWYNNLGPTTITVNKALNADTCDSLRVRIWVIK
jgi:hypothetical protein